MDGEGGGGGGGGGEGGGEGGEGGGEEGGDGRLNWPKKSHKTLREGTTNLLKKTQQQNITITNNRKGFDWWNVPKKSNLFTFKIDVVPFPPK